MSHHAIRVSPRLSAPDLFWWRVDDPLNPMVVNCLLRSDGEWTPQQVAATLEGPVLANIRLRAVPTNRFDQTSNPWALLAGCLATMMSGSRWYWAPVKSFALEDHVKLHVLTEPTEHCLHQFIDAEVSGQLPRDLAQWRAIVVHNAPGGGSCLLLRLHHVIADGAGLGEWFYTMCQPDTEQDVPKCSFNQPPGWFAPGTGAAPLKPQRSTPMPWQRLWALVNFLLVEVLLCVYSAIKILLISHDSNSPLKGPNCGRKRTATTAQRVPLTVAEVKALGKAYDPTVTVNDVLCTLLAGAFRRYFQRFSLHPEQMTMRVTVPVNMRTSATPPIDFDNRFSLVFKSLPIHLPTVRERLASFHVRMGLMKQSIEPGLGMFLMRVFALLPHPVVVRVLDHFTVCSSAVLTNVLTSRVPLRFAGQRVEGVAFWVPTSGDIGLGLSICTYGDAITLGIVADENLVPDLDPMLDCIADEWAQMRRDLGEAAATSPRQKVAGAGPGHLLAATRLGAPEYTR